MESNQKLTPFYFKVHNGTRLNRQGQNELKEIREQKEALKKDLQQVFAQGITDEYFKELKGEIDFLNGLEKQVHEKYGTVLSWCVCFMAKCQRGAEARLIRCVFGGVMNTETQGYKRVSKEVYEFNLNPERNGIIIDQFTRRH